MERERKEKALKTAIPLTLILLLSVSLFAFAGPRPLSPEITPWDYPRLDDLYMIRPENALEAAIACEIDVFIDANETEKDILSSPPYNWSVSLTNPNPNLYNLFKPNLTCWMESDTYGSSPSSLVMPWTFASIHWIGQPVGGSINWHIPGNVTTLNPIRARLPSELMVLNRLFDSLYVVNPETHEDMPWAACNWEFESWMSEEPNVPNGTKIKIWLRNDLRWHDGQPVTAEDVKWNFDFINSTQAPEKEALWTDYFGSEVINDELVAIYVNSTDEGRMYDYLGNATIFPKQIWEPFWGDYSSASTWDPWNVPYEAWTGCPAPPDKPGLTCLFGTGPYWLDYWDEVDTAHLYKNRDYWVRTASGVEVCTHNKYGQLSQLTVKGQCCKELTCPPKHLDIYPPDISGQGIPFTWPPPTLFNPICTQWHETYPECFCSKNYHLMNWIDNGDGRLSPCDMILLEEKLPPHPNPGELFECHVEQVTVTMLVAKKPLDPKPEEPPEYPFTVDNWKYLEYVGDILDFDPTMPVCTQWHVEKSYGQERAYNQYCVEYHLAAWDDTGMEPDVLDYCDQVILVDKKTGNWSEWHVEALKTNIVVTCLEPRTYEIPKITRLYDLEIEFINLQKGTDCTFEYYVEVVNETGHVVEIIGPTLVENLTCWGVYRAQPKLPWRDIRPCVHTWKLYCRKLYPEGWSPWSLQYKKEAALVLGDVNCDSMMNMRDIYRAVKAYATYVGHPKWDQDCDINGDGIIDIMDILYLVLLFGGKCPPLIPCPIPPSEETVISIEVCKCELEYECKRLMVGIPCNISVTISNITDLGAWQIKLYYDPTILNCTGAFVTPENVFGEDAFFPFPLEIDNDAGYILAGAHGFPWQISFNGSGLLCLIEFEAQLVGSSALNFSRDGCHDIFLIDRQLNEMPFNVTDGSVNATIPGDINGDCLVDVVDWVLVLNTHVWTYPGHPDWNPNADINCDCKVDISDIVKVRKHMWTHC